MNTLVGLPDLQGHVAIRRLEGPSLFSESPASICEFDAQAASWLVAAPDLARAFDAIAPGMGAAHAPAEPAIALPGAVAALAQALAGRSATTASCRVAHAVRGGIPAVVAVSDDPAIGQAVLHAALKLTQRIERLRQDPRAADGLEIGSAGITIHGEFDAHDQMLMRAARARGIPVMAVPGVRGCMLLGEGRHGRLTRRMANDRDSSIGTAIAADKSVSNHLINRLGFPGTQHLLVQDEAQALQAARRLGFPLVVKPVARGKGVGVTADLRDAVAFRAAFRVAARESLRGVLVERWVPGDDHRLSVFGGRFSWALARRPAHVVGDGVRTVRALIEAENARREAIPLDQRHLTFPITVDADVGARLARDGLHLESVPAAGARVTLRSVSNLSMGGSYEDVTDRVHPDNRAMAEAIAAAMRMDALGVDFVTTDITRSWREVPGAVIEVNETPGVGTPAYTECVLDRMFPEGATGRLPYVLLAGEVSRAHREAVLGSLRASGEVVGFVSAEGAMVDGAPRGAPGQGVSALAASVRMDPRVTCLVAWLRAEELLRDGLLRERVDRLVLGEGLSAELEALARQHARQVERVRPA